MPKESIEDVIRTKILHVLEHFPTIAPSMLNISLGSGMPADIWQPILEKLIEEEAVYRYTKIVTSPGGRSQMTTFLSSKPDPDRVKDGMIPSKVESAL